MAINLQSGLTFPHCLRDLNCNDHIDPHVVNDLADSTNQLLDAREAISICHFENFMGTGVVKIPFELPDGHTDFVLSVEFIIQDVLSAGGNRAGFLQLGFGRFDTPSFSQRAFTFYNNIVEYSLETGLSVPAINSKEVKDLYRIESVSGKFDTNIFTLNEVIHAHLTITFDWPNRIGLPVFYDHPITGQRMPIESTILGVSLYTGVAQ